MFILRRSAKFLVPIGLLTASLMLSSGATTTARAVKNTPTPTPTTADNSVDSSGDATPTATDLMTLDLSSGDPQDVLSQLQSLNLIPQGGDVQQAEKLYVTARTKGFKYLPIFSGSLPADLVLQFSIEMNMKKDSVKGSGCGFLFRMSDSEYGAVLLTIDRHLVLGQYQGKNSLVDFDLAIDDLSGLDASTYDVKPGTIHTVTIVAVKTTLSFFLDGVEVVTSQDAESAAGSIALLMYNANQTQQASTCSYKYVWFLDLTNA